MTAPARYEILTLEDIIRTYATLPEERGELLLKEIGDAVRIMAPLVDVLRSPFEPITWINDTKGVGNVSLRTADGKFSAKASLDLNSRGR